MADMEFFAKAAGELDINSGSALIPQQIFPQVVDIERKLFAISNRINRVAWDSDQFTYKQRTSNIPAQAYGEGASWNLQSSGTGGATVSMKTIGTLGGVSNRLQAGTKAFINAYTEEIDSAVRGFFKSEENMILNGNASANASQFNGILNQLVTNTSYSSAASPQAVTANLLNAIDDDVVGRAFCLNPETSFWLTTPKMATVIANLAAPSFRQDNNILSLVGGQNIDVWRGKQVLRTSAAEQVVAVSNESVSITNKVGTLAQAYAVLTTFDDQLNNVYNNPNSEGIGSPATAPVVSVGGNVVASNTYTLSQDPLTGATTITFASAPGGAVTVSYFYRQQNIFLVDLSTMLMPYTKAMTIEDVAVPGNYDQQWFRVKAYESLAVMAELGNAVAINVHG